MEQCNYTWRVVRIRHHPLRRRLPSARLAAVMAANPQNVKQYLHTLADRLPVSATIDEALYHLVLRREIEAGLADSDAGRTAPVEEMMKRRSIVE